MLLLLLDLYLVYSIIVVSYSINIFLPKIMQDNAWSVVVVSVIRRRNMILILLGNAVLTLSAESIRNRFILFGSRQDGIKREWFARTGTPAVFSRLVRWNDCKGHPFECTIPICATNNNDSGGDIIRYSRYDTGASSRQWNHRVEILRAVRWSYDNKV